MPFAGLRVLSLESRRRIPTGFGPRETMVTRRSAAPNRSGGWPVKASRKNVMPEPSLGVPVHVIIPEPNTWKEIVEAVAERTERRIAVQEYGRPNPEMNAALEARGATVVQIAIYRWEYPDDREPLREAVRRLAGRAVDVVVFTSSIQLEHLLETAREMGLEHEVREALAKDVAIASVGPVMTGALEAAGCPPDIIPLHPKMPALIKASGELAAGVLAKKRRRES